MANKRLFIYDPEDSGKNAEVVQMLYYVHAQGEKVHIEVKPPLKSREQEQHYHAMIGDIARQVPYKDKMRDADGWWKRLLIDAFKYETKDDPDFAAEWSKFGSLQMVPALNHDGFVLIGEQSRKFSVKLAKGFIEWLGAFGAENNVKWSMSKKQAHQVEQMAARWVES